MEGIENILFKTSLFPITYELYKKNHPDEPKNSYYKRKTKHFLRSLFPPIDWFPNYIKKWKKTVRGDLIAGITVAFMIIPQGKF